MPIQSSATIYVGGLVAVDVSGPTEGVIMLPDSAGVYNETNCDVPLGVCIGTNRKNPLYSSTYLTEYITEPGAADPHDGASIEYVGVEGPWAKGDPVAMVKVALINPSTVLRAPIRNAAIGTPPTVLTATAGNASGLSVTTNAAQCASITSPLQTIYCRTGANAGAYRLTDTSSSTTHTWDQAMRNDTAVGDTFVFVPVRTHGYSTVMFDATTAMFIDAADAAVLGGTDRWGIQVVRLDLSTYGNEYCEFMFEAGHFLMDIERVA
jgi:hypothetical protein